MTTTWLPGARVHDLHPGIGNGPFGAPGRELLGVVLHVNVDEHGTPASFWGNGNPGQVCPNFQVFKDGTVDQMLPFDWQPWCQVDGNFHYAAIETAGLPSEPLTTAQIETCARIMRVYHDEHGVPYSTANRPGARGLGIHSMGGESWGGHSCPGTIRANQRAAIMLAAARLYARKPVPKPGPALASREVEDVFRFKLYTSNQRKGPVYAFAAGQWRQVDAATVAVLTAHGECDGKIHAVRDSSLTALRDVAIGRHS